MRKIMDKFKIKRRLIALLAKMHFFGNASKKLKIIGVTGTNGKTTTATLLYKISTELGYKTGLIGTVDNILVKERREALRTTPSPINLNKLLNEMVEKGCEYVFMEVSSHALDQNRVAGIKFTGGIFTNLTHDHLDYHKDFENYFRAKRNFFEMLPKGAFALSNADDEHGEAIIDDIKAEKFLYGFGEDMEIVDFYGKILKLDFSGLKLDFNGEKINSKLLGKFNAYNLLAIWSTCKLLNFDIKKVNKILEKIEPPRGRFEHFMSPNGVLIVVDYAHSPDSLEKVLLTLKEINQTSGRIISVFGCGGDRDPLKRSKMGKIGASLSDMAIFTSDNPRSENPDKIIEQMKDNLSHDEAKKVITISDRRLAIEEAVEMAKKGDIILCAGKGHEEYQEIKGVKHHFNDIEEFRKIPKEMKNYKEQFKNKKITVMGLGILGRGLGYTKFLAECGADLIVTDLKSKEQLATSIKELNKYKSIKFVLGKHRLEDFRNRDMVMKAPAVPLDSIYIKEARKNNIAVEMDVSLFAKCAPGVKIVGITGTRGKSMTTVLIYEILKKNEDFLKRNVYIGGNVRGVATLPLLKKVKAGDVLVCELDSWQLQGFGDNNLPALPNGREQAGMSPHISVFTSFMPDHMNYYKNSMKKYFEDKANIFKYQKKGDILIIRPGVRKLIPKNIKSKLIIIDRKKMDKYDFSVPGKFQQENLACAVEVAKQFNIPNSKIGQAIKNFKGLEGRLQYLKTIKGVKIYNDNNATTPEATMAGIEALSVFSKNSPKFNLGEFEVRKIILICGGADKKLDLVSFVKVLNKYCKAVVMIPGTGTNILLKKYRLKIPNEVGKNLKDVIKKSLGLASRGDIILFSPAFASFGMFNNEYDRGDQFLDIIKKLPARNAFSIADAGGK